MDVTLGKPSHGNELDEFDIAGFLHQLWANKWLIVIITSMMLAIGIFVGTRQVPQYRSNVLLQVDVKQAGFGGTSNVVQQLLGGQTADSAATQIALLKSRFILDPVIRELSLNISSSFKPKSWWDKIFTKKNSQYKLQVEQLVLPRLLINKKLSIIVAKNNMLHFYDDKGAIVAQGKVGELIVNHKLHIRLKISTANAPIGSEFTIIKHSELKELARLLGNLNITEIGENVRQNTGVLDISLTGSEPSLIIRILNSIANTIQLKDAQKKAEEASKTLEFLDQQLPETKKLLEAAEFKLNHYRAKSGKIDIKLQTRYLLNQLTEIEKKLAEINIEKIEMLQKYTTSHPMMIAQNAEIDAMQAQSLEIQAQIKKLPESDQIAVNLMRDVKVKQSLYILLLKKIQELQVVKAGTMSGVRILSYAKYPDAPLPSKKNFIYLSCLILGLFLSVSVIFGRKFLFPRVDDPDWSERKFNLPNLAIVPFCEKQVESMALLQAKKNKNVPLLAHSDPRNLAMESLRSLRTSLQVSLSCASNNVVAILGVSPGVGKTFITANLSYLLAAAGKRVVVLDADLRRGTLHKYFSQSPTPGITELLKLSLEELENISLPVNDIQPNITLIPRGSYEKNPSELLMSERFKQLVATLSRKYDVVMFDTAPVLLVTDPVVVAGFAATNYLVFGAGVHQPTDIEVVLKRLAGSGVQLSGSVFNFHKAEIKTRYYGKYYYSYKYNNSYYYEDATKKS